MSAYRIEYDYEPEDEDMWEVLYEHQYDYQDSDDPLSKPIFYGKVPDFYDSNWDKDED